ncbi:hypothetical protein ASC58_11605 [Phycicoccus sp. Root101]|nr:hypothetical protein ASC58_11605 [Phycicoccus sp. Root101]
MEVVNLHQLAAEVDAEPGTLYAFYLVSGGEVVERRHYSRVPRARFNLSGPGRYTVKAYLRGPDGTIRQATSASVQHRPVGDPARPLGPEPVHVLGLGPQSLALALVLASTRKVEGLVDPTGAHAGSVVHGIPVLAPAAVAPDAFVVGVGAHDEGFARYERVPVRGELHPRVQAALWPHSAISAYRLSRQLHLDGLGFGADLVKAFIHFRFNSVIPYTAVIGEGTTFGYGGIGVVVHTQAVIGRYCKIGQNVTIGARGNVLPSIGDNVFLGANAVCVGGRIGNRVVVGSNAVVTKEVPDDSVVAGAPARVIGSSTSGYEGYLGPLADGVSLGPDPAAGPATDPGMLSGSAEGLSQE